MKTIEDYQMELSTMKVVLGITILVMICSIILMIYYYYKSQKKGFKILGGGGPMNTAQAEAATSLYGSINHQKHCFLLEIAKLDDIKKPDTSGKAITHLSLSMGTIKDPRDSSIFLNTIIFAGAYEMSKDNYKIVGINGLKNQYLQHIFPVTDGKGMNLNMDGTPTGVTFTLEAI